MRAKSATLYERVQAWLREHPNQCFCRSCILKGLGLPSNSNLAIVVSRIVIDGGSQYTGKCSDCAKVKSVIATNGGA